MNRGPMMIMALLGLCWGPSYMLVKVALGELPPMTVVWARIIIGMSVVVPIALMSGARVRIGRKTFFNLAVFGLLSNVIPFGFLAYGQQYISSALTAIINGMPPILTGLLAHWLIAEERLTPQKILGISLGAIGFALLIAPTVMDGAIQGDTLGILLVVVSCTSISFGILWARVRLYGQPALTVPMWQLLCSAAIVTPAWLVLDQPWVALQLPSLKVCFALAFLGGMGSGVAFILYYRMLSIAGATATGMVAYLLPVVGSLCGVMFLGENLSAGDLFSFGLILSGMVCVNLRSKRTPRSALA